MRSFLIPLFVINYFDGREIFLYESKDDKYCIYRVSQLGAVKNCLDTIKEQRFDPSTNLFGAIKNLADNVYPHIKKQVNDDAVENMVKTVSILFFTDDKDRTFRAMKDEVYRSILRLENEKDLNILFVKG